MSEPIRKLYRSRRDAQLLGICAGVGDYLAVDPVAVRLLWVLVTCVTGFIPGIVAYLLAWLIVPPERPRPLEPQPAAPQVNDA